VIPSYYDTILQFDYDQQYITHWLENILVMSNFTSNEFQSQMHYHGTLQQ